MATYNSYDELFDGLMANLPGAIWDEVLTKATHNVVNSAGRRLRKLDSTVILDGSITAATDNTVSFDGDASDADNIYRGNLIIVMSGEGLGQSRIIVEYDGGTKTAVIDRPWILNPSAEDDMVIIAFAQELVIAFGAMVSATASTMKLTADSSTTDNIYRYSLLVVRSATGAETEARLITAYDGTTQTATVSPDWTATPTSGAVYKIMPFGLSVPETLTTNALTAIWNAATRTLTQSAASAAAAVSGDTITIVRGDTASISLTDLGSLANITKLYFTVKARPEDIDTSSLIMIEQTAGLMYINGVAGTAENGTLTVDDETDGDITITLTAAETAKLPTHLTGFYDVEIVRSAGTPVTTLTSGSFVIVDDYTRAVS
jgi:hypothetical protein